MQIVMISLDQLLPPLVPMRDDMDPQAFQELAEDVRRNGLEQPLVVTPALEETAAVVIGGEGGPLETPPHELRRWRIVAGWRRAQAAREAGLLEVPCIVKQLDELGEVTTMLRENLQREAPSPIAEGAVFAAMHESEHITVTGIAERVGKSPSYVQGRIDVARGPDDVKEALRQGAIGFSVAHELQGCTHDQDRVYLLYHAQVMGATALTVRGWVREHNLKRLTQPERPAPAPGTPEFTAPPILLGNCDWHEGQVPLEKTISFRVCLDCYQQLGEIKRRLQAQTEREEEVTHATPDPEG